ncbi:MAG: cytochrome C oxidase subunit IV family protein [Gammaproteobacteria bacterium]|nr:cytochrome C oxidase subunit IV family protein [Gammaproteobacteria bacterium]
MEKTASAAATRTWLVLVALTLTTFTFGVLGYEGMGLVAAALLIALVKAQLVVDHFMRLRRGAPLWRMLLTGYLFTVGALIAIAFAVAGL